MVRSRSTDAREKVFRVGTARAFSAQQGDGMRAETATSADGTQIAFWREGQGPPLLLVHGGACDHLAWYFVAPLLAQSFTVYSYDRRGRGESGIVPPYAVDREVEDVEAMLRTIREPLHLLGHSAGGILALEAAERTENLLSLILYEPAYVVRGAREKPNPEILEQMNALLAAGNRSEVIRIAIRETVGLPEAEIAAMEQGPGWQQLCSVAHAIPYDWKLWDRELAIDGLSAIRAQVLVLMGSLSPEWLKTDAETIASAVPGSELKVLEGQAHSAMITSPALFAQAVMEFASQVKHDSPWSRIEI
jgi:pimeloyl-ACP methyl ester carboxylesterase